jgi:DMSO/TMAO reductase YedYZ molybdopterin-dependent catalytic subunit
VPAAFRRAVFSSLLICLLFPAPFCVAKGKAEVPTGGEGAAKRLPSAEVRSYMGRDLSSVNDFGENSIKGHQHVDIGGYRLAVGGLVKTPLPLSYDQVVSRQQYAKVVTLYCVEGWDATILWEGVKVKDLLVEAGYDTSASIVIFTAVDGYTTSFPLG